MPYIPTGQGVYMAKVPPTFYSLPYLTSCFCCPLLAFCLGSDPLGQGAGACLAGWGDDPASVHAWRVLGVFLGNFGRFFGGIGVEV